MIIAEIIGGLGNQLFIYAAARSLQLSTHDSLSLDYSYLYKYNHDIQKFDALKHFNIQYDNITEFRELPLLFKTTIRVARFLPYFAYYFGKLLGYNVLRISQTNGRHYPLKHFNNHTYMYGLWQSLNYFHQYRSVLINELTVKDQILQCNEKYYNEIKKSNSVCVHIRRGDYINNNYIVCNKDYYINSMKYIKEHDKNSVFFIFSDDIPWVKNNINMSEFNVIFIENNNPNYEELRLMYSCKNFIISNSTFSWWAQYLSLFDKKIVIAPKVWVPGIKKKTELYMDNWILY